LCQGMGIDHCLEERERICNIVNPRLRKERKKRQNSSKSLRRLTFDEVIA